MTTFAIRWLFSKKVRTAIQMRHHVWKYLNAQRDLLKPEATLALETSIQGVTNAVHGSEGIQDLDGSLENLEKTANRWLQPYPHAAIRENIEVFLVAAAVVLAFRCFFFQPMAIPSGSAQPAFYVMGVLGELWNACGLEYDGFTPFGPAEVIGKTVDKQVVPAHHLELDDILPFLERHAVLQGSPSP